MVGWSNRSCYSTRTRARYSEMVDENGTRVSLAYQYLGPGTHLKKRLKRGDPGINRLDRIAKQHDIDSARANNFRDKHAADRKMIKAIDRLGGRKTNTEKIVKKIMQTKVKLKL